MTVHSASPGRRTRRRVSVTGLAALTALTLGACASNSGDVNATAASSTAAPSASGGTVDVEHYFSGDLGAKAFQQIFPICQKDFGVSAADPSIDHEAFKDAILVQLSGGNPPDAFSYWAGAKTQSLVTGKLVAPIDDVWAKAGLDGVMPASLASSAATYDGKKYLLPFDVHYVAFFYNPAVLTKAGITEMPKTLADLTTMAETLKGKGVTPFALGSKNRWPAQFWFDYLLLRTAGPDYRAKLMSGQAKYTDPQVAEAFAQWKALIDKGYFNASPNDIDWTDAADQVSKGEAAMTLMGTWVTGYWDGKGQKAGTNYNFFAFPEVTAGVPQAALGPVDGWVMSQQAKNTAGAASMLECFAGAKAQAIFAGVQGALPANKEAVVEGQSEVMKAAGAAVGSAPVFVFNYDLATPPAVSDIGLNAFPKFLAKPGDATAILADTQEKTAKAFTTP